MSCKLIEVAKDKLRLNDVGASLIDSLDADVPLNLAFVFGNARSGKSFMMNQLVDAFGAGKAVTEDKHGAFAVINSSEPCTQGVDVCKTFVRHADLQGSAAVPSERNPLCGWVDVEGAGDKDTTYDTLLSLPLLLTSKVILFNHKGAPTVTDMLTRLAVLARAAEYVSLDGEDGGDGDATTAADGEEKTPAFGHLHVLFRDYHFEGDEAAIMSQLMDRERETMKGRTKDDLKVIAAKERNQIRKVLKRSFASISVHLFVQPAEPAVLQEHASLPKDKIDPRFSGAVTALAEQMRQQLAEPTLLNSKELTGSRLAGCLRQITDTLNEGSSVNVGSVYRGMERESIARASEAAVKTCAKACDALTAAAPVTKEALDTGCAAAAARALGAFDDSLSACDLDDKVPRRAELETECARLVEGVRVKNSDAVSRHVKATVQQEYEGARAAMDAWAEAELPLAESAPIAAKGAALAKAADEAIAATLGAFECDEDQRAELLKAYSRIHADLVEAHVLRNRNALADQQLQTLAAEAKEMKLKAAEAEAAVAQMAEEKAAETAKLETMTAEARKAAEAAADARRIADEEAKRAAAAEAAAKAEAEAKEKAEREAQEARELGDTLDAQLKELSLEQLEKDRIASEKLDEERRERARIEAERESERKAAAAAAEAAAAERANLGAQVAASEKERAELDARVAKTEKARAELEARAAESAGEAETRLAALRSEADARADEAAKRASEAAKRAEEAEAEAQRQESALKEQAAVAAAERERLDAAVKEREAEVAAKVAALEEAQATLSKNELVENEVKIWKERIRKTNAQHDKAVAKLKEKHAKETEQLRADLAAAQTQADEATARAAANDEELASLRAAAEEHASIVEGKDAAIATARRAADAATAKTEEALKRAADLQTIYDKLLKAFLELRDS